jgi:hypothetical protein
VFGALNASSSWVAMASAAIAGSAAVAAANVRLSKF